MFSPKKRIPPSSGTHTTSPRVQAKKLHASSFVSPSRPPVQKDREQKVHASSRSAAPMTPPKKPAKTLKSPYESPSSPIASAKKAAKPIRQVIKEETAKSVIETQDVKLEVKSETLFSPAYKIDVDETYCQSVDLESKIVKTETKIEVQATIQPNVEDDCEDEFDPFLFIKNLPPLPIQPKRRYLLPKRARGTPPVCLALDLDETLVHCSIQPIEKAELTFSVAFNGIEYKVYVRMRPYLAKFLRQVSSWFEIVVFTASQRVYADKLLNILDPKRRYIKHRVFRDSCVCVDGNYLKDLTVLGRDLAKVAIVDNSVQAFGFQLSNGIPIESWFDDDSDEELLNLIPFLEKLKDVKDVRPLINQTFRLQELVNGL